MHGSEIRALREQRHMTQRELATALGVGERTISAWERGESIPRNRLGAIREMFGLDTGEAPPLASYSEVALLSELLRRAAARSGQVANG